MPIIGQVNKRSVVYASVKQAPNWADTLPAANWLLFVIADQYDHDLFEQLTTSCLNRQPLAICCAGQSASRLEDWFDIEIVVRDVEWEELYQRPYYENLLATTADVDIDNGFWFATLCGPDMCKEPVDTIVCLDAEGIYQNRVVELIGLINSGWLPPDSADD
ncbi:hypothetical protein GCM10023186_08290 [Hymenobacter koreensis]|uniref:Uncharacterized protein n=2 Tax=Hymenobacter koreensis TaxID=1084523 RepID=A0ABP8IVH0_9BACT